MSFLTNFGEILLLVFLTIDTLGFIAHNRKNPVSSNQKDYFRLCLSWAFFLAIRTLFPASIGIGFINNFLELISLAAKAYVTIPILNGAEKVYTQLVEQNAARHYVDMVVNMVREKMGVAAEAKKTQ